MSLIADLVVTSAAAAYAQFGMTLDIAQHHHLQSSHAVARVQSPRKPDTVIARDCPKRTTPVNT
jgi:hypothetical protein